MCLVWGFAWSRGVPGPGGVHGPRGVCLVWGGLCLVLGGSWWRHSPRRLLLRAVRILLECILVLFMSLLSSFVYNSFKRITLYYLLINHQSTRYILGNLGLKCFNDEVSLSFSCTQGYLLDILNSPWPRSFFIESPACDDSTALLAQIEARPQACTRGIRRYVINQ